MPPKPQPKHTDQQFVDQDDCSKKKPSGHQAEEVLASEKAANEQLTQQLEAQTNGGRLHEENGHIGSTTCKTPGHKQINLVSITTTNANISSSTSTTTQ